MIIQNIGGGLGNQIMIYVFARFLARRNPRQVMLFDDIFFSLYGTAIDSGYRLGKYIWSPGKLFEYIF